MSYLCWRTGPAAESSCHGGAIWAGRVIIRAVANALINGYVIRSLGHRHIIQYRPVRQIDLKQTNLMSASAQILKKKRKAVSPEMHSTIRDSYVLSLTFEPCWRTSSPSTWAPWGLRWEKAGRQSLTKPQALPVPSWHRVGGGACQRDP